ncbi:hypothetical protein [Phaeobacter italicus]|uniref:hypothetical protein n=1 Tax=Phaeobacter italicus TaxID=481446 RepID=UPI00243241C0|nr:hypothetical protein [Phaeobacter italicus]MCI5101270.1 hypothetical protein [Phaeobacter italicus]
MQRFKSWDEIEETIEGGPTEAERTLIQRLRRAEDLVSNPGKPRFPNVKWSDVIAGKYDDRHIRATVLKTILLNFRFDPSDLQSLRIESCFISGPLDLSRQAELPSFHANNCVFECGFKATSAQWTQDLQLTHCHIPYLHASGAELGGQLNADGSSFGVTKEPDTVEPDQTEPFTLNLQDAKIRDGALLRKTYFSGTVMMGNLKVGGELNFQYASFCGAAAHSQCNVSKSANDSSAHIALDLTDATIGKTFYFADITDCAGNVKLTNLSTTTFCDCGTKLAASDRHRNTPKLDLDGFTYSRVQGATDAKTRLIWLEQGENLTPAEREFFPQPYKQLAKVLDDMGHEADAKTVRISLAQQLARNSRNERIWFAGTELAFLKALLPLPIIWVWHMALHFLTDFGYRPMKSFYWLVLLWGLATVPAHFAWEEGSFAPNSAVALQSDSWAKYEADDNLSPHPNPAKDWSLTSTIGRDWESFNRYAYAADLVVPIIDLGQTDAWAPSTTRGPWGWHLWWARWVFTLAGWIVTALGAAALTGVIRRE